LKKNSTSFLSGRAGGLVLGVGKVKYGARYIRKWKKFERNIGVSETNTGGRRRACRLIKKRCWEKIKTGVTL